MSPAPLSLTGYASLPVRRSPRRAATRASITRGAAFASAAGAAILAGVTLPFAIQLAIVGLLVVAALAVALTFGSMRRPLAGVAVVVVVGVLWPIETSTWSATSLSLASVVVGCWLLREVAVRRRLVIERSAAVMATCVLLAVAVAAFVVGQYPWFGGVPAASMAAQVGGLAIYLVSGGLLLLVGHETVAIRQLRRLTFLFIAAGSVIMLSLVINTGEIAVGRLKIATSASIGSVFYVWLVALGLGQALWNTELSRRWRQALFALVAFVFAHHFLVLFTWASSWLPPLIAAGCILLLRYPKLTIAAGLLAVPLLLFDGTPANAVMVNEDYSARTRVQAAVVIGEMVAHSPIIGFGPANYHFYTHLFPILGYRVAFNSHNNYIDLVAQTGLLGFAAFLAILAALALTSVRLARRAHPGFEKGYLMGAFGGVVGTACSGMLGDWVIPFVYNVGMRGFRSSMLFWVFAGGVVAVERLVRQRGQAARAVVPTPSRA